MVADTEAEDDTYVLEMVAYFLEDLDDDLLQLKFTSLFKMYWIHHRKMDSSRKHMIEESRYATDIANIKGQFLNF